MPSEELVAARQAFERVRNDLWSMNKDVRDLMTSRDNINDKLARHYEILENHHEIMEEFAKSIKTIHSTLLTIHNRVARMENGELPLSNRNRTK